MRHLTNGGRGLAYQLVAAIERGLELGQHLWYRSVAGQLAKALVDVAQPRHQHRELHADRVGNGVVLAIEPDAKPVLEELADPSPALEADGVLPRRIDAGVLEAALLLEDVAHAGVAHG